MKTLLVLLAALASHSAFAEISSNITSDGVIGIAINLPKADSFSNDLKDALLQSPLVEEVRNMYVEPGTLFRGVGQGEGITVELTKYGTINISLHSKLGDVSELSTGQGYVIFHGKGLARRLYQVLKTSKSRAVKSDGRDNPDNRGQGKRLFVVDTTSNVIKSLSCSPQYEDNTAIDCMVQIGMR